MQRGDLVAFHCGDVTVLGWKDIKFVTMISTFHNDTAPGTRAGETYQKPLAVHTYNKIMGGIDLKDQLLSIYPLERKRGVKWYLKQFRRLINVSILNSYVIHKANSRNSNRKSYTHRQFRFALAMELAEQLNVSYRTTTTHENPIDSARLDRIDHWPGHIESTARTSNSKVRFTRGRCVRCLKTKKRTEVNSVCTKCNVFLCLGNCFKDYHTIENL